jgi:RNA-directed DNA polymerase
MSKLAWNNINWTLVHKRISRQQRRVYKASKEKNKVKVHAIQNQMLLSLDTKLLAIREITTRNEGHNITSLGETEIISHEQRVELAYKLKFNRNLWIIKPSYLQKYINGNGNLTNIQIIEDRIKQMVVRLVLEPEWEAIFEPNSYAFRPGRSYCDSMAVLSYVLKKKYQYILNIDTRKCFSKIDHKQLLQKLETFILLENQIGIWLRFNIMSENLNKSNQIIQFIEDKSQSNTILPLLINIILHGLENHIKNWYVNVWYLTLKKSSRIVKRRKKTIVGFSRYGYDFIITAPNYKDIKLIENQTIIWLNHETGLELSKIRIKVTSSKRGFEYLGFQIISIKSSVQNKYKTKIYPSRSSKNNIIRQVRKIIQENKSISSYFLIIILSRQLVTWGNYFRYWNCIEDFSKLDFLIFNQIRAWVFRRKSKGLKSRTKLKLKYFPEGNIYHFRGKIYKNNWILTGKILNKDGIVKENFLPKLVWIGSSKYIKIKDNVSCYNINYNYWVKRAEKYSNFTHRVSKLIRIQKGYCNWCGFSFTPMDSIEVDHITPRLKGSSNRYKNLQALHKFCHSQKSHFEKSIFRNR